MLDVYSLGKKGIDYFKEDYWDYFGIMDKLDDCATIIKNTYTFVPDDFESPYPLDEFQHGGRSDGNCKIVKREEAVFGVEQGYTTPFYVLAEFLEKHVECYPNSVYYFNELIHTKSSIDEDIRRCEVEIDWKSNYICMDEQMLYYITKVNANKYEFIDTIMYAGVPGPPYVPGFISDYLPKSKFLSNEEIDKVIGGISIIFAGIYDSEGVIIGEMEEGAFIKVFDRLGIPYKIKELE